MLRMRTAGTVALALALTALVIGPATSAPLLGTKVAGDDADKWMLDDAEVVLSINVKQLLAAESVKKNVPSLKDLVKNNEQLKAILEATGVDPFKDIHSVLASGGGTSAKDAKMLLVVKGNFDAAKVSAAARKKEGVKVHKEGATEVFEITVQEQPAYAALVDRSTLIMTQSKEATLAAIKNGGKRPAKVSKEMQAALNGFTGKETLTFAMVVSEDLKKMVAMLPQLAANANKLQTLTGSITVSDAVALNLTGNTTDVKAARQLMGVLTVLKGTAEVAIQGMEELPPVVNEVMNAIRIAVEKESVTVNLKLTKEMLEKAGKIGGKPGGK